MFSLILTKKYISYLILFNFYIKKSAPLSILTRVHGLIG